MFAKFGRWIWAGGAPESSWARERRLPFWEHPWFNRLYRISMITGWSAALLFFLLWNFVWATG